MNPGSPKRSRTALAVTLAVAVAAFVLVGALFSGPPTAVAPIAASAADLSCSAEALSRVAGLEVDSELTDGWRIAAIRCDEGDTCTRVDVARPPEQVTLRACRHFDGAPLPPETHEGSDVFYDSPHPPAAAVPEATIRLVLAAALARMDAAPAD